MNMQKTMVFAMAGLFNAVLLVAQENPILLVFKPGLAYNSDRDIIPIQRWYSDGKEVAMNVGTISVPCCKQNEYLAQVDGKLFVLDKASMYRYDQDTKNLTLTTPQTVQKKNWLETATEKLGGAISANPVIDWMAWTTVMCSVTEFAYLMMQPGSLSLLPLKWAALGFVSSIVGKKATVDRNTYVSSYGSAAGNGVLLGFLAAWYSK